MDGKESREKRTLQHKLSLGSGKITIKAIFMIVFYTINTFIWLATMTLESYMYCTCYFAHTIYGLKVFDYFELYCNFDNQYAIDAVEQFHRHLMFYANMNGKYFWYRILPVHSC